MSAEHSFPQGDFDPLQERMLLNQELLACFTQEGEVMETAWRERGMAAFLGGETFTEDDSLKREAILINTVMPDGKLTVAVHIADTSKSTGEDSAPASPTRSWFMYEVETDPSTVELDARTAEQDNFVRQTIGQTVFKLGMAQGVKKNFANSMGTDNIVAGQIYKEYPLLEAYRDYVRDSAAHKQPGNQE